MPYKTRTKVVAQNIPWVAGSNLRDIALPTDYPIARVIIKLAGTPAGTTVGAGTPQNTFWPALANALGQITVEGTPLDGSEGIQIRNVAAGALWHRSWMLWKVQPAVMDLNPAALATECSISVPLDFLDPRLPLASQLVSALEAPRYGGGQQSSLNLKILTGNLTAGNGSKTDLVGLVGGNYTTPGPGTLTVTVSVIQLVPISGAFPRWDSASPLPFMDLALEYIPNPAIAQNSTNGFVLQKRGIQAETFFFDCDRDANQIEVAVNNLGVSPQNQLVENLGTNPINTFDPGQMRDDDLGQYLPAAAAFPTGCYFTNDWHNDLTRAYYLYRQSATHSWDLNMGPSSLTDSLLRVHHVTYNMSREMRRLSGV